MPPGTPVSATVFYLYHYWPRGRFAAYHTSHNASFFVIDPQPIHKVSSSDPALRVSERLRVFVPSEIVYCVSFVMTLKSLSDRKVRRGLNTYFISTDFASRRIATSWASAVNVVFGEDA